MQKLLLKDCSALIDNGADGFRHLKNAWIGIEAIRSFLSGMRCQRVSGRKNPCTEPF